MGGTHPITILLRTNLNDEATDYRDRTVPTRMSRVSDVFFFFSFFFRCAWLRCTTETLSLRLATDARHQRINTNLQT
jgi:hypothetical protein